MSHTDTDTAVIILAAGLGTRMKSQKAKVLHEICGVPMINQVVETCLKASLRNIIAVIGYQAEEVRSVVSQRYNIRYACQTEQLGTGHAVMCALPELEPTVNDVIILCGDVPLLKSETLLKILQDHRENHQDITLLTVEMDDPIGYGRIIFNKNNAVTRIVEESDASSEQKKIRTVNAGIYCVRTSVLKSLLGYIDRENAQGEYYLTDIIALGNKDHKKIGGISSKDIEEVIGINSLRELQHAETIVKNRAGKIS